MQIETNERLTQTAVFLLLPLLLTILWLPIVPEQAALTAAVARGRLLMMSHDLLITPSPLGLALALLPTSLTALLSSFGWSASGLLLAHLIRYTNSFPRSSWLALSLLASPLLPRTLATAVSWQTALILALLITTLNEKWTRQAILLLLLPFIWLSWLALPLALALLWWRWQKNAPVPLAAAIGTAVCFPFAAALNWLVWRLPPTAPRINWQLGEAALICGIVILLAAWANWLFPRLQPRLINLSPKRAKFILILIAALPLLLQSSQLWQNYQARPIAHNALLGEVGAWLAETGAGEKTAILAPVSFATHTTQPLQPFTPLAESPTQLSQLLQAPPQTIISHSTLAWDQLIYTGWFQERYRPVEQFTSPESPLSPVTVWRYAESSFDQGEREPRTIHAANGLTLLRSQTWPQKVESGEPVYVTLSWQTAVPLTDNVNTIVRIISPADQVGWAQRNLRTPRSLPPAWIKPAVTTFPERFVLTTTTDIPVGAYQINLSLTTGREETFTQLYQGDDPNPLDRVVLGYVSVPWDKPLPPDTKLVNTRYGEQILLNGYTIEGIARPSETLNVTLFWSALRQPDADYTVFVHLLDEAGNFVLGHDGVPLNGRYPTRGLLPNSPIPDPHPLVLPPNLPPGRYQIHTGLYLPQTGTRLEAVNAVGLSVPNQSLLLQTIEVRP